MTVDLFIPSSRLDEFLRWYRDAIGFFPLWCVPYRVVRDYEWLQPSFFAKLEDRLFIDLAIYGLEQPEGRNYYAEIEEELPRVNGLKTLISHNFYDEETFWKTWNRSNYVAVKRVTDPRNLLRDLYDKTCRAPRGLDDLHGPLGSEMQHRPSAARLRPRSCLSPRGQPSPDISTGRQAHESAQAVLR